MTCAVLKAELLSGGGHGTDERQHTCGRKEAREGIPGLLVKTPAVGKPRGKSCAYSCLKLDSGGHGGGGRCHLSA